METFFKYQNKEIEKYTSLINSINSVENTIKFFDDSEIQNKISKLKKQVKEKSLSKSVLIESFALTREMALRKLGLRHFDTQLLAGLVLNDRKIAEMKTGEGKTLAATLAAAYNALSGKGVHIITVNDYLAKRDKEWMQDMYRGLGFTPGLILEEMKQKQRQLNYACDITYVTNSQLGFDYLKDTLVETPEDSVLRPFNYCIIDEIDSILLDEAQTPLIISETIKKNNINQYKLAQKVSCYLQENIHFEIDKKYKTATLTEKGISIVEYLLNKKNLFNTSDPWIIYITNAIKANFLYTKEIDYIIINNKILIIDEFSGRIAFDRRWSDGLHQAIEAKENVEIKNEYQTLASITYQNLFLLYPKLSGMTGTAKTAENEFQGIYKLDVLCLPTKNPIQRKDLPDFVFKNKISKWNAVIFECIKMYELGRPVLVGTKTVEESEFLSQIFSQKKIPHKILNAKPENIKRESEIIAQAGRKHSLTIATNMAGRGTDIILGGNLKFLVQEKIKKIFTLLNQCIENENELNFSETLIFQDKKILYIIEQLYNQQKLFKFSWKEVVFILENINSLNKNKEISPFNFLVKNLYTFVYNYEFKIWESENKAVINLGGLYVIGTERHISKRVDNQLRGRSGRQGDPGISSFFVSLEDDFFKILPTKQINTILTFFNIESDLPLQGQSISNVLDKLQAQIETFYYTGRKNNFQYDEITNMYRQIFLIERQKILKSKNMRIFIVSYLESFSNLWLFNFSKKELVSEEFKKFFSLSFNTNFYTLTKLVLLQHFLILYDLKFNQLNNNLIKLNKLSYDNFSKQLILNYYNSNWSDFLEKMSLLREVIGWQNYAQKDPFIEYKRQSEILFLKLILKLQKEIITSLLDIDF